MVNRVRVSNYGIILICLQTFGPDGQNQILIRSNKFCSDKILDEQKITCPTMPTLMPREGETLQTTKCKRVRPIALSPAQVGSVLIFVRQQNRASGLITGSLHLPLFYYCGSADCITIMHYFTVFTQC